MNVTSQEFHQVAFSLKELNKVNSKHILENWQREIVAQTLYFRGPLVGVTRRSSWNNVKNLGGEPSMCLTLSCALVSPNNRHQLLVGNERRGIKGKSLETPWR